MYVPSSLQDESYGQLESTNPGSHFMSRANIDPPPSSKYSMRIRGALPYKPGSHRVPTTMSSGITTTNHNIHDDPGKASGKTEINGRIPNPSC